jgi:KDO2-lipid IV(A) lauroyltransferase
MRAILIKLSLRLFAVLPWGLVHAFGAGLARLMVAFPNRTRHVTRVNIALCFPQMSPRGQDQLATRALIEMGKTGAEMGPLWYWPRERVLGLVNGCSGREPVDAAFAEGRGGIITTPHLGNWEMAGLYCSSLYPMTSLYRPPRMEGLDALMREARERLGARLVPTSASGVKSLYKALESAEFVGILADQEPSRGNGIFAPFFGIPAYTMTLLPRLIRRTGAPLFFTYAERLPQGAGFHIHFMAAPSDLADRSVEDIAAVVNAGIEACVRRIPEQYQWGYKRFRTRPEGSAPVY